MAEALTYQQRQAVENRGGKLLVSAAAGSGKTKVLVDRLMGYILDPADSANIDDFLLITYTKAAASELRGKIASKLSELIAQNTGNKHLQQQMQRLYLAKISTVHGFCSDVLRQYAYRLDIPGDFRVADEGECLQLQIKALEQVLETAYENAESNPDFRYFVDSQGLGRDDRQIPEILLKVYNSARCHLNPDAWLDWCQNAQWEALTDAGQTPWGRYLIEDLKQYISLQLTALDTCIRKAAQVTGMEKVISLLESTRTQLQQLCYCDSWDAILACKDVDYGRLTFPKNCSDLQLAEQIKAVRTACKEGLAKRLRSFSDPSSVVLEDLSVSMGAARGLVSLVRGFADCYHKLKRNRGILDFGDLEHKMLDLLLGSGRTATTSAAREIGQRFREIMVDEYQDSNAIQDAIFRALTEDRQNCFMVGDVKQSIYQFRLADPGIFLEKYNTYLPAEEAAPGQGRRVLLSHNFRSSGGVLAAVNDVFGQCMSPQVGGLHYGDAELLREGIEHVCLQEPEVSFYGVDVQQDTYAEEAAFVADEIVRLLDGTHFVRDGSSLRPIQPEDIVILLRSPGSVGGEFRYALQTRGIRCVTGDSANLLHTGEIATVHAILQVIHNPLQDIPLVAALTSPVFGFTSEDLAQLRSKDPKSGFYGLLQNAQDAKSAHFISTLQKLRSAAKISNVTQLLSMVYRQTDLLSIYSAMPDGELRLTNLQSFFQIVSDYETAGPRDLGRFLEFLDGAEERGLSAADTQQGKHAVTLMSIHKSKGLEFPVVFLCGLSRGFNMESAHAQVLCDKDLGLGLGCVDAQLRMRYPTIAKRAIGTKIIRQSISEELRVLYVAMTRARDRLIMTYAVKNLEGNLQDVAMRLDMSAPELLASEADCPGAWVLQTALLGTEAGAFFALGGKPEKTGVRQSPWHIAVANSAVTDGSNADEPFDTKPMQPETYHRISASLGFVYPRQTATQIPSKLTATQLKGRVLDFEIAEGTAEHKTPQFRKPGQSYSGKGTLYGNAMHGVLEHICYDACGSVENIRQEINRLETEQLITPEQAQLADCDSLAAFFASPLGEKLRISKNVLREFKFSVLEDAAKYYPNAKDEKILLQGVVDCAIIEDDGIIVLDFKTDSVTEETVGIVSKKYQSQVRAYADALHRIYRKPIKSAALYFFGTKQLIEVI